MINTIFSSYIMIVIFLPNAFAQFGGLVFDGHFAKVLAEGKQYNEKIKYKHLCQSFESKHYAAQNGFQMLISISLDCENKMIYVESENELILNKTSSSAVKISRLSNYLYQKLPPTKVIQPFQVQSKFQDCPGCSTYKYAEDYDVLVFYFEEGLLRYSISNDTLEVQYMQKVYNAEKNKQCQCCNGGSGAFIIEYCCCGQEFIPGYDYVDYTAFFYHQ